MARLMLAAIYDHAGPNGTGSCWATSEALGKELGIEGVETATRRARALIAELKEGGWVRVVPRGKSQHSRQRDIYMSPAFWDALGRIRPSGDDVHSDANIREVGREYPSSRTNPPVHSDESVPLTSPGMASFEAPPINGPPLSEGEADERLTEEQQRAFWGDTWVDIVNETRPPADAWWIMDPHKALASSLAQRCFGQEGRELIANSPEVLLAGGVDWNDVAASIVITSERSRASIGSLGRYINGIARSIAAGQQEVPEHVDARLDRDWAFLREERIKAEKAWHDKAARSALARHMPGALRVIEALEEIDVRRGVDLDKGEASLLAEVLPMVGKQIDDDWDGFLRIVQDVFTSQPDARLLDVYNVAFHVADDDAA